MNSEALVLMIAIAFLNIYRGMQYISFFELPVFPKFFFFFTNMCTIGYCIDDVVVVVVEINY